MAVAPRPGGLHARLSPSAGVGHRPERALFRSPTVAPISSEVSVQGGVVDARGSAIVRRGPAAPRSTSTRPARSSALAHGVALEGAGEPSQVATTTPSSTIMTTAVSSVAASSPPAAELRRGPAQMLGQRLRPAPGRVDGGRPGALPLRPAPGGPPPPETLPQRNAARGSSIATRGLPLPSPALLLPVCVAAMINRSPVGLDQAEPLTQLSTHRRPE